VSLDVDGAIPFLLERGLIDRNWILDGSLVVRSVARRNRNLRIEGPGDAGLFIKQPGYTKEDGRDTLRCEAAFHRFCREDPAMLPVSRSIPLLVASVDEPTTLIFEAIPHTASLRSRFEAGDGPDLGLEASRTLGHTLGTVHQALRLITWQGDPRLAWLPHSFPSVMTLHRPRPALLAGLSPAGRDLLRVLQTQESLWENVDAALRRWEPGSIIHGDIRFDNILVRPPQGARGAEPTELWIVDWEMVGIGDPAWDLAGALQDFLVVWVASMPLSEELTAEQMNAGARVSLDAVRVAVRALWSGYRAGSGLEPAEAEGLLNRAVAFSAARLIQSAFEVLVDAERLAGPAVLLLQVAANLLAEPEGGRVQLYGIPLGWTAT
jgi:hypothetical protein